MELEGATALVTGGSSGIGAATVARLRARGARVAVLDLQARAGDGDLALECDVGDEASVVDAVGRALAAFGGLDAAVLAAGVSGNDRVLGMTGDEWDRVMRVNLRGAFLTLRECAKGIADAGHGGAIVAVGSVAGMLADRGLAHYGTSKAGVHQLVRIAAAELGARGIRVNAVAPGATDTPMFAAVDLMPGYRERLASRTALGRLGEADDVADAIVALLTLDWVTGAIVPVDGGLALRSPFDPSELSSP